MHPQECLELLHESASEEQPVTVETNNGSFDGVVITRVETPNNQLEVLVGGDETDEVVQFDVKFSVDGSLMNITMLRGDPRETIGTVESVTQE